MRLQAGCLAGMLVGLLVAPVYAGEKAAPLRSFERFEFDSENARGFRGEIAGMYTEDHADAGIVEARLGYGQQYGEAGVVLPYINLDHLARYEGDSYSMGDPNEQGIGDLRLYGKVTPLQIALLDIGGGFELSVPTGQERSGLGAGEHGYLPYLTSRLHLNVIDIGAHLGYRWYSGHESAPEELVYGGAIFLPLTKGIVARAEFSGDTYNIPGVDVDAVRFEPGIDFSAEFGSNMIFQFRPAGLVGMTDSAENWGIGASVVLAERSN